MKEPKKLNVKKITLITLGVLAGLIVTLTLVFTISFFVMFSTYRSEKEGIEISYPKGWAFKANPMDNVFVTFASPKENALDTFYENVNFGSYDMGKDPHPTEDYVKIMIDQLLMTFPEMQLVEERSFPLAGHAGYRAIFSVADENPLVIVVYAFTVENMGYNLLYIGRSDRYVKERPLLDVMALTLKMKDRT